MARTARAVRSTDVATAQAYRRHSLSAVQIFRWILFLGPLFSRARQRRNTPSEFTAEGFASPAASVHDVPPPPRWGRKSAQDGRHYKRYFSPPPPPLLPPRSGILMIYFPGSNFDRNYKECFFIYLNSFARSKQFSDSQEVQMQRSDC